MPRKPDIYKFWPIELAVFKHTDQETGRIKRSFSFKKIYKDKKTGNWTDTNYFNEVDLLKLGCLINNILDTEIEVKLPDEDNEHRNDNLDNDIPF